MCVCFFLSLGMMCRDGIGGCERVKIGKARREDFAEHYCTGMIWPKKKKKTVVHGPS